MPFDFEHNSTAKAESIWGGVLLGIASIGEITYFAAVNNPKIWPPVLIGIVGTVGLGILFHGLASAYTRDTGGLRDLMINDTSNTPTKRTY